MYPVEVDAGLIGIVAFLAIMAVVKLTVMEPQELDKIPFRQWLRGEE